METLQITPDSNPTGDQTALGPESLPETSSACDANTGASKSYYKITMFQQAFSKVQRLRSYT